MLRILQGEALDMSAYSFLCDPRGQLLGAQEESFLIRLFEARTRHDLIQFGGHFPTDPELLRPIAYPHRPGPRNDFLRRLIEKLVSVRVATLIPPEPCLVFDLPPYLGAVSSEEIIASPIPARDIGLIHNSGADPPKNIKEIAVVAAAASDSLDLIEKLRPYFPRHDLAACMNRWMDHRKKRKLALTNESFARWMMREETPLVKKKPEPKIEPIEVALINASPASDQPDLFEEMAHKRFLAEMESRKLRKAAS